jgi:hypothetical protein
METPQNFGVGGFLITCRQPRVFIGSINEVYSL